MRVRWLIALMFAVCAAAHAQTQFMLVSSNPASGATNVPVGTTISLTFNSSLEQSSTFTVRGTRQNVLGVLSIPTDNTITLTPFVPLDPGETYTVDFSGVRDSDFQVPALPHTFQFRTEGSARVVVTSLPQSAQAGAGQRVALSYLLRNLGSVGATITGSRTIYMLPDGTQLLNVNQPIQQSLPANASATVPAVAAIEPAMVAAARVAVTDRIFVIRLFTGTDANNRPLRSLTDTATYANFPGDRTLFAQGLVAMTSVRLLDSITAGAVVRELTVTAPTPGLAVAQGDQVRGRALITASGNGIVIGRWLLDGTPFESFQTSVQAGSPAIIDTVRTLPTVDLGERRLQIQILSPNPMLSRESRFTVSPLLQSGRPQLLSPAFGAVLGSDRLVLRWQVVPGASGYEVGIASSLAALGLDSRGQAEKGFDKAALALQRRVMGAAQTSLALSPAEVKALAGAGAEDLYWTVQPLFPPSQEPMVDRAAFPGHLRVASAAAAIKLVSPAPGAEVRAEGFEFAWGAAPAGVAEYRVQVFAEGDGGTPVFQALTRDARLAYAPIGGAALAPGRHLRWRVLGLARNGRVVAMSPSSPLLLESAAPAPMFAPVHAAFGRAFSGAGFAPASGAAGVSRAPEIVVTYPEADGVRRRLLVDGTDVSALAQFGPTRARLDSRPLAAGIHTVQLVAEGPDGESLEARSWFEVAAQDGEQGLEPDPNAVADGLRLLLQTELHDDDPFHVVATLEGGGVLGTMDGSVSVTASRPLGGGGFELRTLLGNLADPGGRYGLAAGDVGLVGSEFTVDGSTTRAFQAHAVAGGIKIDFTKTLDDVAGRSNFGNSPDVTMGSIETGGFNEGKGLRFVTLRSEQKSNGFGSTGFGPPSGLEADIWSVLGRYKIGETLSLRGEIAHSKNSYLTLSNSRMSSSGDAKTVALDYVGPRGWTGTARYRRTETGFLAPSAALLQNNVQGWDVQTAGPLGDTSYLSVRYGLARNVASSSVPDGNTRTFTANLDVLVPDFVPLQLTYLQTVAKGDSLVPGLPGASTRDTQWTVGTSHRIGSVDASLSYSIARFVDHEDFNDPLNDTPNDRTTRFLSAGLGTTMGRLTLRGDWSDNGVSRFDRDPLTLLLIDGDDRQDNVRLQADYALEHGFSASAIWSRARNSDVLGLSVGDFDDVALRLNWSPGGPPNAQSVVTLEFRRSRMVSGSSRSTGNTFTLLVNGAGIFKR